MLMSFLRRSFVLPVLGFVLPFSVVAQQPPPTPDAAARQGVKPPPTEVAGIPVNYDEAKVGTYVLPDPLVMADGKPVKDAKMWYGKRRPEIVKLFEEQQYGKAPGKPEGMSFEVYEKGAPAFDGKAVRKQVKIYFANDKSGPVVNLLVYTPAAAKKAVPVLLAINFTANSLSVDDPGVTPGEIWDAKTKKKISAAGGRPFGRINPVPLLEAGIGVAMFYYGDIDPDYLGGLPDGIRAKYLKAGQTEPAADEWGAISAWAWGISRAVDYFETDRSVDAKRVAIFGVSRLGKTVMWAGAHDTRIAAVIASCGGEGGAALSHRDYGETIAHLTAPTRYPYQFAANYAKWAGFPDKAPMDANMLVALVAPRPLLLQTGNTDFWSDPKGEFLAAVDGGRVYELLGKQGLGTNVWPEAKVPIFHTLSYYMHDGGHGTVPSDWGIYLEFLKTNLRPEM
jgi:hypothetical protein